MGCRTFLTIYIFDQLSRLSETAQGPFVVPCCTATRSAEIQKALGDSTRKRIFLPVGPLELPQVNGKPVFKTDLLTKMLMGDCGGHGRALEMLAEVLDNVDIGECNIQTLMANLQRELRELYPLAFKWTSQEARSLVMAVLTRQRLSAESPLPNTEKKPEIFVSAGLIRFVEDNIDYGYFEAPYIWIWAMARRCDPELGKIWNAFADYGYLMGNLDPLQIFSSTVEPRYKDPRYKDNRAFKDSIFQGPIFFVCKIRIISNIRISLIFWVPNHSILKFVWLILYVGTQKLQVLYSNPNE